MTSTGEAAPTQPRLARRLGVFGACMLGLGSIVGTGIFVSIGIAAGVAGPAVILAIALAAGLAACNAASSAQLAAAHPVSGGTYEYGYRLLHPWLGFTAGWMFLCAKSASAATAAIGAAGYALYLAGMEPAAWLPAVAAATVALVTALVLAGLRRSSRVNAGIVSITLLALLAFAFAGGARLPANFSNFRPFFGGDGAAALFYATALMFVAYTGYARIATLGEEVIQPRRTIPRAIAATLVVSALLYIVVAAAAVVAAGPEELAGTASSRATPLETAASALDVPGLALAVAVAAVIAMLGVLLNLVLGLSRMVLAMGRRHDLPPALGALSASREPRAAILAVGLVVAALALTGDVQLTWAFSAFTVLVYYALTNLAALRLPPEERLYPPAVAWAGLGGCLFLTPFLPARIWVSGTGLIAAGLVWQAAAARIWPRGDAERAL